MATSSASGQVYGETAGQAETGTTVRPRDRSVQDTAAPAKCKDDKYDHVALQLHVSCTCLMTKC